MAEKDPAHFRVVNFKNEKVGIRWHIAQAEERRQEKARAEAEAAARAEASLFS